MSAQTFELILISPPEEYSQETEVVNQLFAQGLDTFHLRKPGWSSSQLLEYLQKVEQRFHSRIMVHYEEEVRGHVPVKGVHYRLEALPLQKPDFQVSCGIHSWKEFLEVKGRINYAFVSPFFDSISKEGYPANGELWQTPNQMDRNKVVALGGIEAENISRISGLGFKGAAVLGAVWKAADPVEAYLKLKELGTEQPSEG